MQTIFLCSLSVLKDKAIDYLSVKQVQELHHFIRLETEEAMPLKLFQLNSRSYLVSPNQVALGHQGDIRDPANPVDVLQDIWDQSAGRDVDRKGSFDELLDDRSASFNTRRDVILKQPTYYQKKAYQF